MSSPFFTPGRHVAGQLQIPMGTHHVCPTCHNSDVCDVPHCPLMCAQTCKACNGDPRPHSERIREQGFQDREPEIEAEQGRLF